MLAEASSIRAIERITGINRNTIMNLGVRVGQGCAKLIEAKMRSLTFLLSDEDDARRDVTMLEVPPLRLQS